MQQAAFVAASSVM